MLTRDYTMKIIRRAEVRSRVGYSDMHLYRLERAGQFPKRIPLGPHSVGWLEEEIENWISEKLAARDEGGAAK